MRFSDLLLLAFRMIKVRIMRTALTVLGVSVGIGAILFLVSLGYGLQKILLTKITSSDALLSLDVVSANPEILPLDQKRTDSFGRLPNVAEVSPLFVAAGRLTLNGVAGDVAMNAVHPSFFRLGAISAKVGRLFGKEEAKEVVISSAAVKLFSYSDSTKVIGQFVEPTLFIIDTENRGAIKEVPLRDKYLIAGVIDDDQQPYAFIALSHIQPDLIAQYQQLKVKVARSDALEPTREAILSQGFTVSALSDTIDQANKIFQVIQIVLALFGLVALAVSAIGMFNTMTIALLERTQEIGIFKALGAARRDVSRLFLTESSLIGFFGGVGGIALGLLGGRAFNLALNLLARALGGETINLFFTPAWFIITIAVFSTIVGFLTGIFPARRAARLNPLTALRYK